MWHITLLNTFKPIYDLSLRGMANTSSIEAQEEWVTWKCCMFAMLENDVLDKVNPVWYVVGIIKTRGYVYSHIDRK
jgi:hypothetical protein